MDDTDHPLTGAAVIRRRYGSDESQYGQLHLPAGGRRPGTVIVIHGGFWKAQYGADLGAPLAADLAARGWAAWNLEYRRVGNGGGWPNTMADVAAGIDLLAELGLDLGRVVAIGHSAGGHLATWAAGRPKLPDTAVGGAPLVRLTGVIAQAGVLDLVQGAADGLGSMAVPALLGGMPDEVPERYRLASPRHQLPLGVPVRCVHSPDDDTVPFSQSADYVQTARAAGDDASLIEVTGGHFGVIDPASAAWQAILGLLPDLLAG
ncbi:MAG TPA: alpha/beta hydrolase [Jatrophihabitans sp.]|uniref:alpha/beta hydrolase family protein n=1 Tax=Jatrophihabitans sp. TaxID=1932789 RepID=UPI002F0683E5